MAINFSAAGKTALVVVAVWGIMHGTNIVRTSAAMMAPARDVGLSLANGADGVIVGAVAPGSDAAKAGIKAGDLIVGVGRLQIHNMEDYLLRLGKLDPGEAVSFMVSRNGAMPKHVVMGTDAAEIAAKEAAARAAPSPIGVRTVQEDTSWRVGFQLGDAGERGPVVGEVEAGGLAEKAGFQVGDVLTSINGRSFIDTFGAADQLKSHRKGNLSVKILRKGEPMTLTIARETPPAAPAQSAAERIYGQLK